MNSEEFKHFLELLSSTSGEDGVELYCQLYRKLEGIFTMKGVRDIVGAANETIERAYKRISEGASVPDVEKYCKGIARFVAKERLRRERRESTAFLEFINDLNDNSDAEVSRIDQVLKPCFELLDAEDRKLLADYCRVLRGRARAEHRRELAAEMKTTVPSLRMQVTRLRRDLAECAEERSKDL
jgi:hypothetical protein